MPSKRNYPYPFGARPEREDRGRAAERRQDDADNTARGREADRAAQDERDRVAERERESENSNIVQPEGPHQPDVVMMAVGGGTGKVNMGEHITPVDIPRSIFTHPFQNTVTVSLPYKSATFGNVITSAASALATDVYSFTFRLNSPRDVITEYTYAADPAPTSDTFSGTQNSPMYWNYYSSMYRYYTVIKSHYKVTIRGTNTGGKRWSVWSVHHGMQGPPIIGAGPGFGYASDMYKSFWPHARFQQLVERGGSGTAVNSDYGSVLMEGDYYPGRVSVQNDVVEDELARTWHPVSEVPPLKELCTIIVHKSDFEAYYALTSYLDVQVEVNYTVQFKDLKEIYQYPILGQDLPAIVDYCNQTN